MTSDRLANGLEERETALAAIAVGGVDVSSHHRW